MAEAAVVALVAAEAVAHVEAAALQAEGDHQVASKACLLCPRNCSVDRFSGEIGFCGASNQLRIARAALHFWEEPCISGERGSGTVFFSFCSLKCVFCQNESISQQNFGKEVSVQRLAEIFLELQAKGALNINLVTPTHYIPWIKEALILSKSMGLRLPIVYNSGGYETVEGLGMLEGLVDVYMPDMKYWADDAARELSNAPGYFSYGLLAVAEMYRQVGEPVFSEDGQMLKGVLVRHLLMPGQSAAARKILEVLYQEYENRIYYSLMSQYTPMTGIHARLRARLPEGWEKYKALEKKVSKKAYWDLVDYAIALGIENAFVQEGDAARESFIPPFTAEGI